ncbi:MAG: hydrogenase maturation protease [Myxococcota bacterium]
MMRIVVVGLGSELMGDDAAGLRVIDLLSEKTGFCGVDFKKCFSTGFEVMESIEGYDKAIIVDSVCTGLHRKGEIVNIEHGQIKYSKRISSFHDFDLMTSVELGRRLNLKVPSDIKIYGIEIEEVTEFHNGLSREVNDAVELLASKIYEEIQNVCKGGNRLKEMEVT